MRIKWGAGNSSPLVIWKLYFCLFFYTGKINIIHLPAFSKLKLIDSGGSTYILFSDIFVMNINADKY